MSKIKNMMEFPRCFPGLVLLDLKPYLQNYLEQFVNESPSDLVLTEQMDF